MAKQTNELTFRQLADCYVGIVSRQRIFQLSQEFGFQAVMEPERLFQKLLNSTASKVRHLLANTHERTRIAARIQLVTKNQCNSSPTS